jgi:deoxyribodipyrimidine photolyase-related protein
MRRKTGILMDGDDPVSGRWNYDSENRKPPKTGLSFQGPARFPVDSTTEAALKIVDAHFGDHFGALESDSKLILAVLTVGSAA